MAGWGYQEFNYWLNENGDCTTTGMPVGITRPTCLLAGECGSSIGPPRRGQPFFVELATFAPHEPYTPAPRDAHNFPGLRAPRPRDFDVLPTHPPDWLAGHPRLTPSQVAQIDSVFRRRAQSSERSMT